MTAFNEQAEVLLGRKAQDLQALVEQGQEEGFKNVFSEKNFRQYVFRVRAQEETQRDAVCELFGLSFLEPPSDPLACTRWM